MEGGSGPESGGLAKASHDFVMGGMSLHQRKKCEAWGLQATAEWEVPAERRRVSPVAIWARWLRGTRRTTVGYDSNLSDVLRPLNVRYRKRGSGDGVEGRGSR